LFWGGEFIFIWERLIFREDLELLFAGAAELLEAELLEAELLEAELPFTGKFILRGNSADFINSLLKEDLNLRVVLLNSLTNFLAAFFVSFVVADPTIDTVAVSSALSTDISRPEIMKRS